MADKAIDVVDKGVDLAAKVDGILTKKLDSHYEAVAQRPPNLINPDAVGEIAKNMKPGSQIEFNELSGFNGIEEYRPPGWKITSHATAPEEEQPEAEEEQNVRIIQCEVIRVPSVTCCSSQMVNERDSCCPGGRSSPILRNLA